MIGVKIARELIEEKRDVVIIEKNAELARRVDNELDCLVINDDGSRPESLREAKAETADWFIALTGSDAVNIVACGLVSAESPNTKTIARVETPFYSALSKAQQDTFGLDYLLNPAMETARSLDRIIGEGFAGAVVPLHEGALQLRTVVPTALPDYIGKTLGEIRQSSIRHFLIAAVVRSGSIIVPKGDCRIEADDLLYVLGPPESLDAVLGPVAGVADKAKKILIMGATKISERFVECMYHGRSRNPNHPLIAKVKRFFSAKPDITLVDMFEEKEL